MIADLRLFAVTPAGPVRLPISGRGARAADVHGLFDEAPPGVYSGLRSYRGCCFLRLEAHLDRTARSMSLLGWSYQLDRPALRRALHQAASDYPGDVRVRFDVLSEPYPQGDGRDSRVLLALSPLVPVPSRCLREGVRVGLAPPELRRDRPLIKTTDFVRARRVCTAAGAQPTCYEHVMIDGAERLLEGISSNIYGVRGRTIITAGDGVLEGITRGVIYDLAAQLGLELSLSPLHLGELDRLDEAFLTSSTREIVPVVELAGRPIGDGRPGEVTRRLLAAYQQHVADHARPAVDHG